MAGTDDAGALSVKETARLVAAGELSAVEAVTAALERAQAVDPELHAFITIAADDALREARLADRRAAAGEPLGPLHGVPTAVKDLEWTAGIPTTYGVTKFAEFVPERDSVVVERLRGAGAIVIGKTSTPEFALLGETRNPLVGETRNPWDTSRTTGGSSGGSAAAVAAGVVALALGSDSAGSIPAPAAMCGVFGMKPTRGLVPVWPDPGDARLFLDPGPLAASVADGRAVIEAVAGPDARDPTSFRPALEPAPERPLRIAWNPDWGALAVDRQVRSATAAAAEALASLGHALEEAHPALEGDPFAIATPLLGADLWTLFEREQIEEADLSEEAWAEALLLGCPTSTEYVRALNRLSWHRRAMDGFFEDFDLMLSPATAVTAFPAEQPPARIDAREVDQRWNVFMPFQVPCNLAGMPTASLPCGVDDAGLPIGLQVSGPRGSDLCVLSLCEEFERLRPWPLAGTGKII